MLREVGVLQRRFALVRSGRGDDFARSWNLHDESADASGNGGPVCDIVAGGPGSVAARDNRAAHLDADWDGVVVRLEARDRLVRVLAAENGRELLATELDPCGGGKILVMKGIA